MSDAGSVAAGDLELARQFAQRLCARGEGDEESDLDLFVALEGNDPGGAIKQAARRNACDLTLQHGLPVSVFVADRAFLDTHSGFAFVEAVHQEGVAPVFSGMTPSQRLTGSLDREDLHGADQEEVPVLASVGEELHCDREAG